MERKKEKNMYISAVILLDILLIISLFHGYNVEKSCQSICEQQINRTMEAYGVESYGYINLNMEDENDERDKLFNLNYSDWNNT